MTLSARNRQDANALPRSAQTPARRKVEQIRAQGYGYTENIPFLGGATLCVLLPVTIHNQPVALGLGGVVDRVRANRERYLVALQRAAKSIQHSDPFDMPIDIEI